jgi:hypothetical protein
MVKIISLFSTGKEKVGNTEENAAMEEAVWSSWIIKIKWGLQRTVQQILYEGLGKISLYESETF